MTRPLFTILLLLLGYLGAFAQVKVTAALDNSKVLIGDQIKLLVEANYPSDHQITDVDLSVLDSIFAEGIPEEGAPDPGMLEVLRQTEWETLENGGYTTYRKNIFLISWLKGVYYIPQIRFTIQHRGNTTTRTTNKLTLLVSSPISEADPAAVDTTQITPIKQIVQEEWQFSDFLPILYLFGGAILFLLLIVFIIRAILKRTAAPPPIEIVKRPAHEIALYKLEALKHKGLWQSGEVKAYQSQLTYISREYIENRYDIPALESTTGEILSALKKVDFPSQFVQKMREMLQLADMVKFAKANPPEEMHTRLMGYAEEIVQETKAKISAEEEQVLKNARPGAQGTLIARTVYAHPGKRFLAGVLDGVIFHLIIGLILFILSLFLFNLEPGNSLLVPALSYLIATLLVGFSYYAFLHAKIKQTPGKFLLGIELVQLDGKNASLERTFLRFCIKILSFILLFLPLLPILFNQQRQALHDILADTIVIEKRN